MKTIVKILAILLLAACSASNDNSVKQQIESKKAQVEKLQKEIAELEKQQENDTTQTHNEIAVEIKEIQPEEFNHYITVFGNVEADKYAKISPEMNGQIKKIHVEEGQRVNAGNLLVSLNTETTESSINEVKTNLELATTTFEKQKSLWEQGIGSEMQYLQAKANKEGAEAKLNMLEAQLRMSQIRAPFDGLVDKIYLKEGELAGPAVPVIEFVNLARLNIKADVSETYIGSIRVGEEVQLSFPSIPEEKRTAKISRIAKVINPSARTFQVEVSINNPGEKIRPNMVCALSINDYNAEKAFVVPSVVIKRDITGDYLYVASENGKNEVVAEKKYIKRGMSNEGFTLVTDGLSSGDKVIVAGYNMVSTGTYVNVIENI